MGVGHYGICGYLAANWLARAVLACLFTGAEARTLLWAFHPLFKVVDREWEEIFQHWTLGLLHAKRLITLFAIKVDSLMLTR